MDVSPSDAVSDEEMIPDDGDETDDSVSITDMLLNTEPAESPSEYEMDDRGAHILIGIKKMINGAGMGVKAGVPAIQNFAMAGITHMTRAGSDGGETADSGQQTEGDGDVTEDADPSQWEDTV